jgi:pimeloyl-ACP methyl ester carboxylesterase
MQVIGGAGHLTNLEKPNEFNRLTEEFIAEIEQ